MQVQLDRADAGLAMYDETPAQAINTGRLRHDSSYAARWLAFEEWHDRQPDERDDVFAARGW